MICTARRSPGRWDAAGYFGISQDMLDYGYINHRPDYRRKAADTMSLILCDRNESPGRAAGPGYESREIPFRFAALWSARWEVSCALVADTRDSGGRRSPRSCGTGSLRHLRMSSRMVERSIRRALPIITRKPCFSAAVRNDPGGSPSSAAASSMVSSRGIGRQASCSPGAPGPALMRSASVSSMRSPTPNSCIWWRR